MFKIDLELPNLKAKIVKQHEERKHRKSSPIKLSKKKFTELPFPQLTLQDLHTLSDPYLPLSGVYLIYRKGRLIYIGYSTNIHGRIVTHHANGRYKKGDHVRVMEGKDRAYERSLHYLFNV